MTKQKHWSSELIQYLLMQNKRKQLVILVCFLCVCLLLVWGDFRISHIAAVVVLTACMFWFYLVKAKKVRKEK